MKPAVPHLLPALQLAAPAQLVDVSRQAGLSHSLICGDHDHKAQLIEALESGLAGTD